MIARLTEEEFREVIAQAAVAGSLESLAEWDTWPFQRGGHETRYFSVAVDSERRIVAVESHRAIALQSVLVGWTASRPVTEAEATEALGELLDYLVAETIETSAAAVKIVASASDGASAGAAASRGFSELPEPGNAAGLDASPSPAGSSRGWIRWIDAEPACPAPVYLRQRTDFTCGPTSYLMARGEDTSFDSEMQLWREATYVMGCDAFGLACAARRRGVESRVLSTTDKPILTDQAGGALTPDSVNLAIHASLRARAENIPTVVDSLTSDILDDALEAGKSVLALIDLEEPIADHGAHWILVWSRSRDIFVVHDPWTEPHETWVETACLPIAREDLWRIAQWNGERAFVEVHG